MSWATSSGRVAATPKTEAPRKVLYGFSAAPRLREERGDRPLRARLQARELHRRERAVGAADVVVEDVVDAELGRRDGEVDLVAADDRVGEVGEAAVGRAVVARRRESGSPGRASRATMPTAA